MYRFLVPGDLIIFLVYGKKYMKRANQILFSGKQYPWVVSWANANFREMNTFSSMLLQKIRTQKSQAELLFGMIPSTTKSESFLTTTYQNGKLKASTAEPGFGDLHLDFTQYEGVMFSKIQQPSKPSSHCRYLPPNPVKLASPGRPGQSRCPWLQPWSSRWAYPQGRRGQQCWGLKCPANVAKMSQENPKPQFHPLAEQ